MPMTTEQTNRLLAEYADRYETADFLTGDPSWFMHQVEGRANQETMAFIASCLSYGSRKQFFPKIQYMLDCSGGKTYDWVASGAFANDMTDDNTCFYRLYTRHAMRVFLSALRDMLCQYGSIGQYVAANAHDGLSAVTAICAFFHAKGVEGIVPKDASSACKRVCMFLRWMVRDGSPVDLGLWSGIVDKRTLIMPMDTHVVQEALRLALLSGKGASMAAARRLTARMAEVFPDDPLKGDFALFGYGVNNG
jgi:uncharacterized protein (TIGR02757 family)